MLLFSHTLSPGRIAAPENANNEQGAEVHVYNNLMGGAAAEYSKLIMHIVIIIHSYFNTLIITYSHLSPSIEQTYH